MTRAERDAELEQRLKDDIAARNRRLAQVQARQREEARKAQHARRYQVGKLADEAGLCGWDDATLRQVFQVLAGLQEKSDPATVLAGMMGTWEPRPWLRE